MSNPNEYKLQVPNFQATSTATGDAIDRTVAKHHELIDDLKKQLTDSQLPDNGKLYVIYFLGELRARQATSALIENIEFQAPFRDMKGGIGRWGMHPAAQALVKVGTPAVNMIMDVLPDESNEQRRQLMCIVMADTIGASTAIFMLQQATATATDQAQRNNLNDAIARLGKIP